MNSRFFWLVSILVLGFEILLSLLASAFFGFFSVIFFAKVIGFLGFILRKKWGYFLSLFIQIFHLTSLLFFSRDFLSLPVLQVIGLIVMYLSKDYFV